MTASAIRLNRRTRPVERQIDDIRRTAKRSTPVCELPVQHAGRQHLPLPVRVVGVLNRQIGERRFAAGGKRVVQCRELAAEDAQGPPVGDDVMHRDEQQVARSADAIQAGADEHVGFKIERVRLPRPSTAVRPSSERSAIPGRRIKEDERTFRPLPNDGNGFVRGGHRSCSGARRAGARSRRALVAGPVDRGARPGAPPVACYTPASAPRADPGTTDVAAKMKDGASRLVSPA